MDTFVFPAFIEGDARDGYSAFFPDLPGCTTAAATMTGLAPAAREALELHLKGMREDGQAIPDATAVEALQREPETANAPVILVDATVGEPRLPASRAQRPRGTRSGQGLRPGRRGRPGRAGCGRW